MNIEEVRADIPLLDEIIYLDAASTTPTPKPVIDSMCDYYYNFNANIGRGAYRTSIKATSRFEKSRSKIANFIKCKKDEIIFTKNTTEALNTVANGLELKKGDSIILPIIEHHSNFVPWLNLKKKGIKIKIIKTDEFGVIDPYDVEKAIDRNTKLITITHISNAMGTLQPIYEVGQITDDKNILYLIDAAQSAGHLKIDLKKSKADFIAFPGHKGLLGPVGTGFLYCSNEMIGNLEPMNLGGGTVTDVNEYNFTLETPPARFEGGTQNIAGFIGLGAAIDYIERIGMNKIERHTNKLTQYMYEEINNIENTICYGRPEDIYGILAFNIEGLNSHDVAKILDEVNKICVRSGYHCAMPTIEIIGAKEFGGTVRASIHYYNTKEEIQTLKDTLNEISSI
jgi:cysteine desulfurase / selenocysteine lyase